MKVDDILNPSRGYAGYFMARGSNQTLISTTSFAQTQVKAKYIVSPTRLSRVIFRGNFGYTVVKDLDDLPLSLNFAGESPPSVVIL